MAVAGSLWININANSRGLASGINQANSAIASLGQGLRTTGRRMTALGDMLFNFAENFTQAMIAPVAALLGIAVYAASKTAEGKAEIDKLKESWQQLLNAMAPVGVVLLQMANVIMPSIVKGAQALSDWFMSLSKTGQWVTVSIMLLLAALGPLVMFFAAVTMLVGGIVTIFGLLLTKTAVIIGAIIGLSAAFEYLWATNSAFKEAVLILWQEIQAAWYAYFEPMLQWVITNWPLIRDIIIGVWQTIWTTLAPILTLIVQTITLALGGVLGWIITNWPLIKETFMEVWNFLQTAVPPAVGTIQTTIISAVEKVKTWFETNWPKIKSTFMDVWNAIVDFIKPIVKAVVDFLKGEWTKWQTWWDSHGQRILAAQKVVWQSIKDFILLIVNSVKSRFEVLWPMISEIVTSAWEVIKSVVTIAMEYLRATISMIAAFITGDWEGMWEQMKSSATTIMNAITNLVSNAMDILTNTMDAAFELMYIVGEVALTGLWNLMKSTFDKIIAFLKGIDLADIGKQIIAGLASGITAGLGKVKSAVAGLAAHIPSWAKDMLGIHSPSRVMMEIGAYTGEGLEVGILKQVKSIQKAAGSIALAAVPKSVNVDSKLTTRGGIPLDNNQNGSFIIQIGEMVVRDDSDIQKIAQQLSDLMYRDGRARRGGLTI
jgi:phage-related protein